MTAKRLRKTWTQLLVESLSKPGINFPPLSTYPMVRLAHETSPRAARCRICEHTILANEHRVVAYVRRRSTFTKGGTAPGTRYQYHRTCIGKFLGGTRREPDRSLCYVCAKVDGPYPLSIAAGVPYGRICQGCLDNKDNSYAKCTGCKSVYQTRQLQIADQGAEIVDYWEEKGRPIGGKPVCGHCQVNFDIPTTRNRNKRLAALQRYADMLEGIRGSISTWLNEEGEGSSEDHDRVPPVEVPSVLLGRFGDSSQIPLDQIRKLL